MLTDRDGQTDGHPQTINRNNLSNPDNKKTEKS